MFKEGTRGYVLIIGNYVPEDTVSDISDSLT